MTQSMSLSSTDVTKLAKDPAPEVREDLARKLAYNFAQSKFSEAERVIALEILRVMTKDVALRVRQAMALELKECLELPHDIALRMAHDVMEVALPVLECSPVLTEEDLVSIVRSTKEISKLNAIARRASLSEEVSASLIETRANEPISLLFNNMGAVIPEPKVLEAWDFISTHESMLEALVYRGGLSLQLVEKMFTQVSERSREVLMKKYHLGYRIADRITIDAREWAMLGLLDTKFERRNFTDAEIDQLVNVLAASGHLNHSFVLRALCLGHMNLFESSISKLARVNRFNARLLLFDSGPLGFEAIYNAAGLPEGFREATRVLLKVALEETQYGRYQLRDFRKRVVGRIHAEGYLHSVENMATMMHMLGGLSSADAE